MAKQEADRSLEAFQGAMRANQIPGACVFFGEEQYLRQNYLEMLRKKLLNPVTESFNFHKLTPENFDGRAFSEAVESMPMMAEHTLVQVDEIDLFKLREEERNRVAEVLSDIPPYCHIVFTYETTPWKPDKRMKKLWEAISQSTMIVNFRKQDQRALTDWIRRHFYRDYGKQIAPELCAYLITITGGSMTTLLGEIEKIAAYSEEVQIQKADIDAVVEPVLDAVVFRMTDLMGAGEYGAAFETLLKLLKMQEEPIAILGAVGNHFRRLSAARTLLDGGKRPGDLMRLYAMPDFAARNTMEAARRFSPDFCRRACRLVVETDYRMKTSADEEERLLEMLVLRLAQEARHG